MATAIQARSERDQHIIDETREDLLSGRSFELREMSARSWCGGYEPPMRSRDYGHILQVLGKMAADFESLAPIASKIVHRLNQYGTRSQARAAIYGAAAEAVREGWDDVIGRSGPEAGRYSDHQHKYNLNQLLWLAYWLESASSTICYSVPGVGWPMAAIADDESHRGHEGMKQRVGLK